MNNFPGQTSFPGGNRVVRHKDNVGALPINYYNQTGATFANDGQSRPVVDSSRFSKLRLSCSILHASASGDGAFRVYDITAAGPYTPEITVTQNTTTLIEDTEVTKPAGASGDCQLRYETKSGQAGQTIRLYGGGSAKPTR